MPPGALLGILLLYRDFLMKKWWGFGGHLCVLLTLDLFLITTKFLGESRCSSTDPSAVACRFCRSILGRQLVF